MVHNLKSDSPTGVGKMILITMINGVVMQSLFGSVVLLGVVGLVGCGGGGGGSNDVAATPITSSPIIASSSSLSSGLASSSSVSSAQGPVVLQPITRANAPYFAVSIFDAFDAASTVPAVVKEMISQANLLRDGQYSSACSKGGTYVLVIGSNPRSVTETFTNCNDDEVIRTGRIYYEVLPVDTQISRALIRYDHLQITSAVDTSIYSTIFGDIEYEGEVEGGFDPDRLYDVKLNITEQDSKKGEYSLRDLRFRLKYFTSDSFFPDKFAPEQSYSGNVVVSGIGAVDFEYSAAEKKLEITGSTDAIARVTYDNELFIYWDAENDGWAEAQLFIGDTKSVFDAITSLDGKIVPSGADGLILDNNSLYMSRGKTFEIDIRKTLTHNGISLLDYSLIVDGNSAATSDWNQIEPGKFVLTFGSNTEDKTYNLILRVSDTGGKDTYEIPVSFFVGSDYDGDGMPDTVDGDDDNDGVPDALDEYPLDKYESADIDGDGVPDNRDADADGDGVPNFADSKPLDYSNCAELSERDNGGCYLQGLNPKMPWMMDNQGTIYFESYIADFGVRDSNSYMYRLDKELTQFLEPIRGVNALPRYVATNNTFVYQLGRELHQVNLDTQETRLLMQFEQSILLEHATANYVVIIRARDRSTESQYVESYDYTGRLIHELPLYADRRTAEFIALSQLDPNCPIGITSDDSGMLYLLLPRGDAQYCVPNPRLMHRLSPDGSKLYRSIADSSDGGIFSTAAIESGFLSTTFNNQPLITISPFSYLEWVGENYVLQQQDSLTLFDATGVEVASTRFDDEEIQGVFTNAERIAVVSRLNNTRRTIIRMFDAQLVLLNTYEY